MQGDHAAQRHAPRTHRAAAGRDRARSCRQAAAIAGDTGGAVCAALRVPLPGRSSATTSSVAARRVGQPLGKVAPVAGLACQPAQQDPRRHGAYHRPIACAAMSFSHAASAGSQWLAAAAARVTKSSNGRCRRSTRCWRWAISGIEDARRARTAGGDSSSPTARSPSPASVAGTRVSGRSQARKYR